MKISQNFHVEEFVPKSLVDRFGVEVCARNFISQWQIDTAEAIRKYFGVPVTINDWKWGGRLHNRGTRSPYAKVGASYSQHKMKCALDFNVKGWSSDDVWNEIRWLKEVAVITTIEAKEFTPTWTHIDCRRTGLNHIFIVKP